MRIGQILAVATVVAALGGLVAPVIAETRDSMGGMAPDQGTGGRGMGRGMMSDGMTNRGMMGSGCAGMMQSMNNGNGQPNRQWQKHPPATPN
jgi:hypothetical protein